jgi:hypothetical protein
MKLETFKKAIQIFFVLVSLGSWLALMIYALLIMEW